MKHPDDTAIGGYFALETAQGVSNAPFPENTFRYQSARSAMSAALRAHGVSRVWLPGFICGAVRDAIECVGAEACPYRLSEDHGVPADLAINERDMVVCVDYFGLNAKACDDAIRRFGRQRLLVDASQAMFHAARPGVATVYSPRKFVGVPDGGLLVMPLDPGPANSADEEASAMRSRAMRSRSDGDVAGGYRLFQLGEATLSDCAPRDMSEQTRNALALVDWDAVRARRIANYARLAELLTLSGYVVPRLAEGAVPLCCPVGATRAAPLRYRLAAEGIFTAMYWPDADLPADDEVGHRLRDRTIYLPCDQRYGEADMLRIARTLARLGGRT